MPRQPTNWMKNVDWSRSNRDLAKRYGVDARVVAGHRRSFFRMLKRWGAAKRYGVSGSHVTRMRKKFGIKWERAKKPVVLRLGLPKLPGRPASIGLLQYVLATVPRYGTIRFRVVFDAVTASWGKVSERSVYAALARLVLLQQITFTAVAGVREYRRILSHKF